MNKLRIHTGFSKHLLLFIVMLMSTLLLVAGCSSKPESAPTVGNSSEKQDEKDTSQTTSPSKEGTKAAVQKVNATSLDQNECSECHEMWPEVATWQTSVHANVSCVTCHEGYDPNQNRAAHESGSFQKPIAIRSQPVSDKACRSCHAMYNRVATLLPDLIAPHEKHEAAQLSCLECHRFTTHGNIAERKVTTRSEYSDYNKWSPQMAKQVAPGVQRRPNMFVCIKCHEQRKVTTDCAACHYWEDRKSLPSHENQQWGVIHGKEGRQNVDNCAKCHYDKESQKFATPSTGDKIADFARANTYCYGCHLKRPGNHDGQWMAKHPQMAKDRGLPNCFACHDRNQPRANVTGTYCNTCHWFEVSKAPATDEKAADVEQKKE